MLENLAHLQLAFVEHLVENSKKKKTSTRKNDLYNLGLKLVRPIESLFMFESSRIKPDFIQPNIKLSLTMWKCTVCMYTS